VLQKKICLLGAFAVGKTSLVRRFVHSAFSDRYLTTVGVKIDQKTVRAGGLEVSLIVWDLHGEDDFQSVRSSYLRGAAGVLLVIDGTRAQTLETAFGLHQRVAETVGGVPCVAVLNKADLKAEWDLDEAVRARLRAAGWPVLESSAKTGEGVELAFRTLAERILEA
jgi:small GTP-binding protein